VVFLFAAVRIKGLSGFGASPLFIPFLLRIELSRYGLYASPDPINFLTSQKHSPLGNHLMGVLLNGIRPSGVRCPISQAMSMYDVFNIF
jgi:hypothetical protein